MGQLNESYFRMRPHYITVLSFLTDGFLAIGNYSITDLAVFSASVATTSSDRSLSYGSSSACNDEVKRFYLAFFTPTQRECFETAWIPRVT